MITEHQIEETLRSLFGNIEFTEEPKGLYDPLRYTIGLGGKRVRPRLCLLVYSLYKDEFDEGILSPATALEVFHTFTLIHDDIMDNAPIRRGEPTVHVKWSDNTAILSGDVMSIDSYRRMAKAPAESLPKVLELFSKTAAEVCEGQQYDMEFEDYEEVPMGEYMKMIGLKTAVLIACAAKMGALIAGVDEETCEKYYKFGYNLGLAFQIADDYLDTYGDEGVFGKAIGGDIVNGKKTWLLTRALEKAAGTPLREELLNAMAVNAASDNEKAAKIARVKAIYEKLGVDEDAKYEILSLHALATAEIDNLGLSKVRSEMLHRYADRLIGRTK